MSPWCSLDFHEAPHWVRLCVSFCLDTFLLSLGWAGGYNITPCVMAITIQNPWFVLIAIAVLLRGRNGRHCPQRTKPYKVRQPPFAGQSDFLVIKLCWLAHPLRIWGRLESPALRLFFCFLCRDVPWALVVVGLMTDIPFRGECCPLFSAFWPVTPSSMDFCLPQKEAFMIEVEGSFNLL